MPARNYGACETCRTRVPATHAIRDGKVYLCKQCPDCGVSESLISSDAARWQRKREIWQFDPDAPIACAMHCESCRREHHPRMVFLDVTNRCNMNCPICIANIPGMGFEFHPPLEYFDRVLAGLAKMDPKPTVQLFGGEPTVREDLFEIIDLCRKHELRVRIVTNGLRLADEDYCRKLCETKIPVLLAFDGRDPAIYERLRKAPGAYEKKLKALENLRKFSRRKNILMCCVARHINDQHMADLIAFCHENRDIVSALHLIPLTENWEEGEFETDVTTTIEDVEQIITEAIHREGEAPAEPQREGEAPAEPPIEFISAGLGTHLAKAVSFFGSPRLTFGGAHPNCESMTILFSDGQRFRPMSHYLKRPLDDVAAEVVRLGKKLAPTLAKLSPDRTFQRWRGRFAVVRTLLGPALATFHLRRILKGNRALALLRIFGGFLLGRKLKDQLRKHTTIQEVLHMLVLPFEEYHSIESARLDICPSGFAYEDPDTGEIKTIPVCIWSLYRTEIQRKIAEKYAPQAAQISV